jgi:hypothetical protein
MGRTDKLPPLNSRHWRLEHHGGMGSGMVQLYILRPRGLRAALRVLIGRWEPIVAKRHMPQVATTGSNANVSATWIDGAP